MWIVKKVHIVIGTEILALTAVVTAALTSVLFLFRLLQYADYIFMSGEGLLSIFMFVVFLFPSIFKLSIPLSLFVGTTIAIARMSQDREIEAWMSCGAGVLRLCIAPGLIGASMTTAALYSSLWLEPAAREEWLKYKWMFTRRNVEQMIESRLNARTFVSQPFGGAGESDVCLYVDWLSDDRRTFKGVFVAIQTPQDRYASVLVAESGGLQKEVRDGSFDYVFHLKNGRMYEPIETPENMKSAFDTHPKRFSLKQGDDAAALMAQMSNLPSLGWRVIRFDEINLSMVSLFQERFSVAEPDAEDIRTKRPRAYLAALKDMRKDPAWKSDRGRLRDHTFFYEQISIPLACLFMPFVGVGLGIFDPRRRVASTFAGVGLCIFVFYASIMISQQLPAKHIAPPEVMLIIPNVVLAGLAIFFVRMRVRFPPSVGAYEYLGILWSEAKAYFRPKRGEE